MASLKSPRPTPKFFLEHTTLSTKKARATPREKLPPKPPVKSAPPVSRIFQKKIQMQRAQAVSFRASESSILSKHYNESSKELYFDQCFEIKCKLGAGSFGEVFKVRSKEDGNCYAVKRSRERFKGENDRKRKLEEVAKHQQLPRHSNCILFIKAWEERQHLYIQTELCETSLSNYCEQTHDIPEVLIWNYLVDLLLAVKHLHDHNLIHMDIKPANIFISKGGECKLGDFGLVFDLSKGDLTEAMEGDPKYLAPEVMQSRFTKAADIFSLGITILELACDLDLPCGGDSWHKLRQGKLPNHFMQHISIELQHIIQMMMMPDYKRRPNVERILEETAVKNVWRKRRQYRIVKSAILSIEDLFQMLASRCAALWRVLFVPIRRWWLVIRCSSSSPATPTPVPSPNTLPRPSQHPSDWDYSFSDDDCFDDEPSNQSHSSIPKSLNISMDSANGSVYSHKRLVNSTPQATSGKAVNDLATPSQLPEVDWECSFMTRSNSNGSPWTGSSGHLSLKENFTSSIEPRNLMEIFEAISSDEDDD